MARVLAIAVPKVWGEGCFYTGRNTPSLPHPTEFAFEAYSHYLLPNQAPLAKIHLVNSFIRCLLHKMGNALRAAIYNGGEGLKLL